jgi:hypothetical protein
MTQFTKGMKAGAIKGAVDKAVSPITTPVVESITLKLKEMNPKLELTAPMVDAMAKAVIILGIAELTELASAGFSGKLPIEQDKIAAISEFMREYAGEKFGNEIVETAFRFAPMFLSAFSEFSTEDLRLAMPDPDKASEKLEAESTDIPPKLIEEDDENNEHEEEVAVVSKGRAVAKKIPRIKKLTDSGNLV